MRRHLFYRFWARRLPPQGMKKALPDEQARTRTIEVPVATKYRKEGKKERMHEQTFKIHRSNNSRSRLPFVCEKESNRLREKSA